jgi:hypothetical protein
VFTIGGSLSEHVNVSQVRTLETPVPNPSSRWRTAVPGDDLAHLREVRHRPEVKFGATKLNKILYFSDFLAFARFGEPITGVEYQREKNGPVPKRLVPIRNEMIQSGELALQPLKLASGRIQHRTVNLREPDLNVFTPEQIALIDSIIEALRDSTAEEVSEISHRMVGWKIAEPGESIPDESVFVSDEPLTEADIQRGKELAKLIPSMEEDWFTGNLRDVRREPLFDEQLAALGLDPRRVDDALSYLDYALARHPEVFPKVPAINAVLPCGVVDLPGCAAPANLFHRRRPSQIGLYRTRRMKRSERPRHWHPTSSHASTDLLRRLPGFRLGYASSM